MLNNDNIVINNSTPDLAKTELEEKGFYKTKDNFGVSYYLRGKSSYNYVLFANKCFRVVRIEGDGSVKLLLQDKDGKCDKDNWNIGESEFGNESLYKEFENELSPYIDNMKETYWCKKNNDTPTLICSEDNSEISFVNALSKDEVIFGGAVEYVKNSNLYLKGNYWTNTDSYIVTNEGVLEKSDSKVFNRPSIVLKNSVLVSSGDGSISNPYIVK